MSENSGAGSVGLEKKKNKQYSNNDECDFRSVAGLMSNILQEETLETVSMTQETTLVLIGLVEAKRCLWDRSDPQYKHRNRHQDAWQDISEELEIPSALLREKWKSLQSSYRHYKRAYEDSLVTGSGSRDVDQRKWFAYEAMSFTDGTMETGLRVDTMKKNTVGPSVYSTPASPVDSTPALSSDAMDTLMDDPLSDPPAPVAASQQPSDPTPPPPPPPPSRPANASRPTKRRWHEANLRYNEEVLAALGNVAKATMELRSVSEENRLAPLYSNMRDWSPTRKEAMLIKIQAMIAEENIVRFVEKHGYDPRD